MRKVSRIATLLVISIMLLGIVQIQPTYNNNNPMALEPRTIDNNVLSLFDSPNITVGDISPVNGSLVSGSLNIDFNLTSDYGSLNLTIFVEGEIYPSYNKTIVTDGVQSAIIDTTTLFEGLSNFTMLFEYINQTYDRESIYLSYIVDNDGQSITADVLSPVNGSKIAGLVPFELNISSNYGPLNFTLFVDGEIFSPYSQYLIGTGHQVIGIDTNDIREGLSNFTLQFWYNSSGTYDSKIYYLEYIVDNDGQPITVYLISPSLGSSIAGNSTISIDVGSDYVPLSTSLLVDGSISEIDGVVTYNGVNDYVVDTTVLSEGLHNFTFVFAYNSSLSQVLVLEFTVDNYGFPSIAFVSPEEYGIFTGFDDFTVNITSGYAQVYANVTVDDVLTSEYNQTLIDTGITVLSINGSRYENGLHNISVTVWTEESAIYRDAASRTFNFLDYVRFYLIGVSQYSRVAGNQEIQIEVTTPYSNVTLNVYNDEAGLIADLSNVVLYEGNNIIHLNVTAVSEGEHNYTFKVTDPYGHSRAYKLTVIVDNHGIPTAKFVSPSQDIVVGVVTFDVKVDTTWDTIYMSVYVDDVLVEGLSNIPVHNGDNTFTLDVGAYSKWQHVIRLEFETPENETTSIEKIYGFATIRIEEIASAAILLAVAFLIPIIRHRQGQPIRPILFMDLIFFVLTGALFLVIGVSSLPTLIWHFNLTSIWTLGCLLIFCNWVYPILASIGEEE